MKKRIALPAGAAFIAAVALVAAPGGATAGKPHPGKHGGKGWHGHGHHGKSAKCGKESRKERGYTVIFDGSRRCLAQWAYVGGASVTLQRDGTLRTGAGEPGLGTLWYKARPYGDFSLRLQFRDDAPAGGPRANSGVQVRFPAPEGLVPECSDTADDPWIAVRCGHEIQINDNEGGDARKTGSIYGFADLDSEASNPTPAGVWNDLEIKVEGQHYTVIRNGEVINEFENAPGIPFPGRPDDPGSSGRGRVGYLGLQAHGAPTDVVSFRNIRVRDITAE
jgi:hypothetical protein